MTAPALVAPLATGPLASDPPPVTPEVARA